MVGDGNNAIDGTVVAGVIEEAQQDNYYFFDTLTNNGVVMNIDLSSIEDRTLTTVEVEMRDKYTDNLEIIERHYRTRQHPQIETMDDILSQRVVATSLETNVISSRSDLDGHRACRLYPPKLYEWPEFAGLVNEYHIHDDVDDPGFFTYMLSFFFKKCHKWNIQ
jgi:hypothetical protein